MSVKHVSSDCESANSLATHHGYESEQHQSSSVERGQAGAAPAVSAIFNAARQANSLFVNGIAGCKSLARLHFICGENDIQSRLNASTPVVRLHPPRPFSTRSIQRSFRHHKPEQPGASPGPGTTLCCRGSNRLRQPRSKGTHAGANPAGSALDGRRI